MNNNLLLQIIMFVNIFIKYVLLYKKNAQVGGVIFILSSFYDLRILVIFVGHA